MATAIRGGIAHVVLIQVTVSLSISHNKSDCHKDAYVTWF